MTGDAAAAGFRPPLPGETPETVEPDDWEPPPLDLMVRPAPRSLRPAPGTFPVQPDEGARQHMEKTLDEAVRYLAEEMRAAGHKDAAAGVLSQLGHIHDALTVPLESRAEVPDRITVILTAWYSVEEAIARYATPSKG